MSRKLCNNNDLYIPMVIILLCRLCNGSVFYLLLYLIVCYFLYLVCLEFHNNPCLYLVVIVYSCVLFIVPGFHFFHIVIGICIHGVMLCLLYPI